MASHLARSDGLVHCWLGLYPLMPVQRPLRRPFSRPGANSPTQTGKDIGFCITITPQRLVSLCTCSSLAGAIRHIWVLLSGDRLQYRCVLLVAHFLLKVPLRWLQ